PESTATNAVTYTTPWGTIKAIVKSKIVECLDRVFDWPSVTSNWTSWPARPRYGAAILEVTSVALAGK
ncbi:hypothetical protein, partial [Mesorhizobium sp.]|uniref:hypothetical protein n=1 Tax=Mesorhizobium sp. TaxID=1871066 RepID=UPI0025C0B8FB